MARVTVAQLQVEIDIIKRKLEKANIDEIRHDLDNLERDLRTALESHDKEDMYRHEVTDKEVSLHRKILFSTISFILMAFLTGLTALVFKGL